MEQEQINIVREKRNMIRDRKRVFYMFFLSVVICAFICFVGSANVAMDVIALACYFAIVVVTYLYAPDVLLKYIHFWIMSSWAVLSLYFLENGNIHLRGNYSEHFGSLPLYVLSWIAFYLCVCWMELRKKKHNFNIINQVQASEKKDNTAVYVSDNIMKISYVAFFLLLACFASISYKPYFLLGIDRFVYKSSQLSGIVSMLSPWFYCLIPIVLMTRYKNKKLSAAYLILLALFCIWQGEKFSGLLRIIFYTMIAVSPEYAGSVIKKNLKKIVKAATVVILSLLIVVIMQQIILYQADSEDLAVYFENRLVAQGELWWLTYKGDADSGTHWNEIGDEISVWIEQPSGNMSDYDFGIYKLMKKFMNSNWVTYTLALGIRGTEATRASLFYYGKAPALLIGQMLLAFLVYFTVNSCTKSCNKQKWFLAILYLYMLQNVISAAYMMDIQLLTTKKMILVYAILILASNRKIRAGSIIGK